MAWLWSVGMALIVLYGLTKVFPIVATVWMMRKVTYCCLRMAPIKRTALSEAQRKILKPKIKEIQQYGFKSVGCWQLTVMPDQPMQGVLMRHKSGHTYALLHIHLPFNHEVPVTLHFSTLFTDGHSLETTNTPDTNFFSRPAEHSVQCLGNSPVKALLNAHRQQFMEIKKTVQPRSLPPKDFIAAQLQQARDQADYSHRQKEIQWVNPGETYRMRLGLTFKMVREMAHRMKQHPGATPPLSNEIPDQLPASPSSGALTDQSSARQSSARQSSNSSGTDVDTQVELDVVAFMRARQTPQSSPSRRNRTFILLASLAFFLVASTTMFDGALNWPGLLAFAGVIAIHEGGHALAMKAFGYRDTAVLFVPFFGALATAKKEDATLTEKVWIALAGPLPGIGLGIGLAIARSQGWVPNVDWIDQTIGFFLFLNLFNLIPIYPLDGGQVANHLIFSRHPYLGVIFQSIGVLVLALLGLGSSSVLLLGFAGLIALSIPQNFRTAKLNVQLRQELLSPVQGERTNLVSPLETGGLEEGTTEGETLAAGQGKEKGIDVDTDAWVRRIFTTLHSSSYRHLNFAQKSVLAKSLLDSRTEHMAPIFTRVGLSSIYLTSLILGGIGSVYALSLDPLDARVATSANDSMTTAAADDDYFDRFYDEEFAAYYADEYFSGYEAEGSHVYTCPNPDTPPLTIGAENNDVMRDRQITLVATFESEAIAQSVLTTLQPSLAPSDRALLFGQSVLVSTISQTTQTQLEAAAIAQGGTILPTDGLDEYGVSVYIDADAPDEQTAKQVVRTFWFFQNVGLYSMAYVPPMPWETPTLTPAQQSLAERAKYTYRRLTTMDTWSGAAGQGYLWKSMLAALTRNYRWIEDEQRKMAERQIKATRKGVQDLLESNDPHLDPETVTLYLQQANLQHQLSQLQIEGIWDQPPNLQAGTIEPSEPDQAIQQEQARLQSTLYDVQQRLGQRIWQIPSRYALEDTSGDDVALEEGYPARPWFNSYVQYEGTQVQFYDLSFSSLSEMLPEMTEYLCDRHFTNIRYTFVDGAEIWNY